MTAPSIEELDIRALQLDLKGKIRNTKLPVANALWPLFEAVVNSIHAIEDSKTADGRIDITIERDLILPAGEGIDRRLPPIKSFTVIDNGIGFNDDNLKSFLTSDSTHKAVKGAKGVGRFIWLKAFDAVRVESDFYAEGKLLRRQFDFCLTQNGIENYRMEPSNATRSCTSVKLDGFLLDYEQRCPSRPDTIAARLIEHCLITFFNDTCPHIVLHDNGQVIELNALFKETVKAASQVETYNIKQHPFRIIFSRVYGADAAKHRLHFCANGREVFHEGVASHAPDFAKRLQDADGKPFACLAYVSGAYLDGNVNLERTAIAFKDDDGLDYPDLLSRNELVREAIDRMKHHFRLELEETRVEKIERIRTYINTRAPRYRPLLTYWPHLLDQVGVGLSDERLDVELHRLMYLVEADLRERGQRLREATRDIRKTEKYRQDHKAFAAQVTDVGAGKLAEYVIHRGAIISLLDQSIQQDEDGRFCLEEDIHEIFFPMRSTSQQVTQEHQNLWLIDERLAFHHYLASDIPLRKIEPAVLESGERPDLIVFNNPIAFSENSHSFSSIVIVEFKRPERDSYPADEKNPIEQVLGYVELLQEGKAKDRGGKTVNLPTGLPFYAYIVCDLTPKLKRAALNASLTPAPDGQGYFGFNPGRGAYVEVISYQKLLADAKRRNQILFDKLSLVI